MRRLLLLLLACLAYPLSADAAIAVVSGQIVSGFANDFVGTFPSGNTSASNHVLVAATINNEADTASITGIGTSPVTLHGPTDYSGGTDIRLYIWCYAGDGDDDFTVTTAGSAVARVVAVEISGGSCTESGTSGTGEVASGSPHTATASSTTSGAFGIAIVQSTSAADFSLSVGTATIPTDGSEINTLMQGGYATCTTSCLFSWNSAAGESTLYGMAAVEEGSAPTNTAGGPTAGVFGR